MKKPVTVEQIDINAVHAGRPVSGSVKFSDGKWFGWAVEFGWDGSAYSYRDTVNVFTGRKPKAGIGSYDPVKLPKSDRQTAVEEYLKRDDLPEPGPYVVVLD